MLSGTRSVRGGTVETPVGPMFDGPRMVEVFCEVMMRRAVARVGLAIALCGCGMSSLSQKGAGVGIGKGAPDGEECRQLGLVYGSGWGSDWTSGAERIKSAQNELRNKTADLGGNFVVMDVVSGGTSVSISGQALQCKQGPRATAAASAAPQPSVESRITALKELHDKGLITDSEYDERRKNILNSL
jgi:uncharacterized protein DUF4156/putative oligomerization/nucleic acid binding protein